MTLLQRLGPQLRPVLHRVWQVSRGLTLGVRGVVIDGERVFLVKHSYVPGWYLPGGGVEPGETAEAALVRELREEGGIVTEDRPTLIGFYHNPRASPRDHVALFRVERWTQPQAFAPSAEILAADFFPLAALPADVTASTRRRLAELREDAVPALVW